MNIKKILFSALLAAGCFAASAQQEVKTENVFKPHWYIQGQAGFQHTLGEIKWSDLNSFNAQLGVGYQFSKLWGARLSVNTFQSKAGVNIDPEVSLNPLVQNGKWKWNYLAPSLDFTFDLSHALFGYNPTRLVDFSIYAGLGLNIAWNNDEANTYVSNLKGAGFDFTPDVWDGTLTKMVGRWGANLDFRVNDHVSLGLEASWNVTSDSYNSKRIRNRNADWYFNTLAGIKYNFGKTYDVRTTVLEAPCPSAEVQYVHDTVYVNVEVPVVNREPLRRDIFFVIRGSKVSKAEMPKVEDVVAYLNKYPEAKVEVTGYADKKTGNPRINAGYAQKRAEKVVDLLVNTFGISRDRIVSDSKGDTVQPYEKNELNRVAICIAE